MSDEQQPQDVPQATVYQPGTAPGPYGAASGVAPEPGAPEQAVTATAPVPPASSPEARAPRRASLVATATVAALVGGLAGAGAFAIASGSSDSGTLVSAPAAQNITINDPENVSQLSAVAAKVTPSVVTLSVAGGAGGGTGSGVIIREDGYIVTNTHVVTLDGTEAAPDVQVRLSDGSLYAGDVVGTDPYSDLAVVKIDASGLTPIEWGNSDKLNVGATTIAIGAPMDLANTVTTGIVSALNRGIEVASSAVPDSGSGDQNQEDGSSPFDFWNFQGEQPGQSRASASIALSVIQTDAAINPGNSGGALLDASGKLIGINVAILSNATSSGEAGNIGLGFAVPVNLVKRVASEIIETGSASHGLLGASVTSAAAQEGATSEGALIAELSAGGAAQAAGLKRGDIVTGFNGVPVTNQIDLTALVRAEAAGARVKIEVLRGGERLVFEATLGALGS